MSNDLEQRLRAHLHREAANLHVPGMGAPAVAARRRARRRRIAATSGAGMVVALVTGAAVINADDAPRQQVVTQDPTVGASGTATDDALRWRSVPATAGLIWAQTVTADDGTLYALSSEPGKNTSGENVSRALYRSTDGVEWEVVTLEARTSMHGLAVDGDRLYVVGTAPANGGADGAQLGVPVVATSTDGGATFTERPLPFDTGALEAVSQGANIGKVQVAVHDDVVLATVGAWATFVPSLVVGDEVDTSWGWTITAENLVVDTRPDQATIDATGIGYCGEGGQVVEHEELNEHGGHFRCDTGTGEGFELDPNAVPGLPGQSYSWTELGVDPAVVNLLRGIPAVFASRGGAPFEPVTLPSAVSSWASVDLDAGAAGFVLTISTPDSVSSQGVYDVFRSSDGVEWSPLGPVATAGWIYDTGVVNDSTVIIRQDLTTNSLSVATTTDGSSWTNTDPGSLIPGGSGLDFYVESSTIGDRGIGLVMAGTPPYEPSSEDAAKMREEAAGNTEPAVSSVEVEGPGTEVAPDPASLTENSYQPPVRYLVHSADGVRWSVTALADITDAEVAQVHTLSLTGDRVVIGASLTSRSRPDGLQDRVALVGEPA